MPSFGQWIAAASGGMHLGALYQQNVPVQTFASEAVATFAKIFPPEAKPSDDPQITHADALRKIADNDLTDAERAALRDYAGGLPSGGM